MTKVGAYAILRMYTLVFGPDLAITEGLIDSWLLFAALLTVTLGMIGILGSRDIMRMTAFATIGSVGTLLVAISLFTPQSAAAAIYYMVHSTFASAMLFLVADLVIERRGGTIAPRPPMPQGGVISVLYFGAAIAMAGMPPLSGFIGKLLVLEAGRSSPWVVWIWAVILITSLVAIVGLGRAGSLIFWKSHDKTAVRTSDDIFRAHETSARLPIVPVFALMALIVGLTFFAGPMLSYAQATAQQLYDTDIYIGAVLTEEAGKK